MLSIPREANGLMKGKLLILIAIAINNFGDILFDLFVAWGLSINTGSFMGAVYVIGTSVGFRAFLSFFVGSFTDRHSRKKLIIVSHCASIVIIGLFGMLWSYIQSHIIIGVIFVLLNDISNEVFLRSYISLTADKFDKIDYIKFQNVASIVTRIIGIFGAAISGFIIQNLTYNFIFTLDIITFLISLTLFTMVKDNCNSSDSYNTNTSNNFKNTLISDIKYTIQYIRNSSYIKRFIAIMLILNLGYGFIPQVFPIIKADEFKSASYLGFIKSFLVIGELVGLVVATKFSRYISSSFKLSMTINFFVLFLIGVLQEKTIICVLFFIYGTSDSLTQPFFNYTVSNLDSNNRGKLLGGIDAIIMLSPSVGIYAISFLFKYNYLIGTALLSCIFLIAYLLFRSNEEMNEIVIE